VSHDRAELHLCLGLAGVYWAHSAALECHLH